MSTIVFTKKTPQQLALEDIKTGLQKWKIWLMFAYLDIKLRYRRSVLGPFWITISMAITIYSMGYLYAHLFHTDLQIYYPFLAAGMLSWAFISTTITELIDTFTNLESTIKQIKLPYSLYIHRVAMRNLLVFFHNILAIIPILVIFHEVAKLNYNTLFLIPSLIIIYINTITYGLIFAMIGARYRDISQITKSAIQVIFFLTPIMWKPEILPVDKRYITLLNPFFSLVELIRAPLLGTFPSSHDIKTALLITLLGIGLCYKMFTRYRTRIIYWL